MFERLEKIVDKDKLNALSSKKIMVIGIGGVGGYVVEALTRCNIGNFILIDHDVVDITNKNRQIIALDSTIGKKKVEVMKDRVLDINKECNVTILDTFLDKENTYDIINQYKPDYVIDCCDTITAKLEIIKGCLKLNIDFITCLGTGNKFDPSKLTITYLNKTHTDPLAKVLRKLVKEEDIKDKIPVLWSSEEPVKTHDNVPGSNSFIPSSAGLMIAAYVFNNLVNNDIIK